MNQPTITVTHTEDSVDVRALGTSTSYRMGLDVEARITYSPGQHTDALNAVDRLAADLRRQIANATESTPREKETHTP